MRRNTTQKMALEQVFRKHERPLGLDEILKYGRKLNQATVYRNLNLLIDDGWLKRISHECTGKEHHHHFHRRECNRAFETPGCAMKEEDTVPDGFAVEDHEIFLFGVCPPCAGVTK